MYVPHIVYVRTLHTVNTAAVDYTGIYSIIMLESMILFTFPYTTLVGLGRAISAFKSSSATLIGRPFSSLSSSYH